MSAIDNTTVAIVRSFQARATMENFDRKKFEQGRVVPIRRLLADDHPALKAIVVVVCGDKNSPHGEIVEDDSTATINHLRSAFPVEVGTGKIIPVICRDWGQNVGSSKALNAGIAEAQLLGAKNILMWSPRVPLTATMFDEMSHFMAHKGLGLVGYMRKNWYRQTSWMFAQNTCALWSESLLRSVGGMNPDCDGTGQKITLLDHELKQREVPVAGMEDWEVYLRMSKMVSHFFPWGMVGMKTPVEGDESLKRPGTDEYQNHQMKILRQVAVMEAYAKRIFPELDPEEVFENAFKMARFA